MNVHQNADKTVLPTSFITLYAATGEHDLLKALIVARTRNLFQYLSLAGMSIPSAGFLLQTLTSPGVGDLQVEFWLR